MSDSTVSNASAPITDSRLAALCAQEVERAFLDYQERFHTITRRARERFIARDWPQSDADAAERLRLYERVVARLTTQIEKLMGARLSERSIWTAIKAAYSVLIANTSEWEIAESFFNSLTRRVFATAGVDQAIEFVDTDFDVPPINASADVRCVYFGAPLVGLLFSALTDPVAGGFAKECWDNFHYSLGVAAKRIETAFAADRGATHAAGGTISVSSDIEVQMVGSVFYRGRGAYVVGRVICNTKQDTSLPFAVAFRHDTADGITLDAVLLGEVDLAILFSYTRSYFRVDAPCPYGLVRALHELMPRKRLVDLYNAIGYYRHGKTEFYRDFVAHLRNSHEHFTTAEGARGMVMIVFTLPSYDVVFKLIKDHFDFPKESTRREVMRRYRLVFEHDRAGRLVEAHEFEHLRIPRERFEPALLEDLLRDAPSIVRLEGDDVIIAHTYVERRIRPLNLFFAEADTAACTMAARDYGQAIKDLAASNIFPGDLLTKNFGVTRHGRVVFYDYDELCFVTDCNFRDMPQASTHEEEMSAEPWFSVREHDIFPEEFPNFLRLPEPGSVALFEHHADLFRADFWRGVQGKLRAGEILEVFPYRTERRIAEQAAPISAVPEI